MLRVLWFSLKIALLVALAVWLADRPGRVSIVWLDRQLDTTVGILLLAVLVAALLVALAYRFWRFLFRAPRDIGRSLEEGRRRRGYQALTQGMVAVAAGEPQEAARLARKADALLAEPPLTLLLSAQAAQLNGEEPAARRYFEAMLERPETRFLGLRGLLTQALRDGDQAAALDYARRAYALRPRTAWVATALFDLSERQGDLAAAEQALADAVRIKALPAPEAERKRAVLLLEKALSAQAVDPAEARRLAKKARKLAPELVAATALLARLLIESRDAGKAVRLLEEAWRTAPHPELAALHARARPAANGLERLQALARLTAGRPDHVDSHLALARAALAARLWGEARRHLKAAAAPGGLEHDPGETVCQLMAELEEAEHGDTQSARRWLTRAAAAPPDPAWTCRACGAVAPAWSARCGACQAFDGLDWRSPPRILAAPGPQGGTGAGLAAGAPASGGVVEGPGPRADSPLGRASVSG